MTNKDITKIYFCGDEIAALYQGSTLIFKKSGVVPPKPTGVYTVRGTLKTDSTVQSIQLCVNDINEQIDINEDKTFEHTFVNVPVTRMNNFTSACKDELKTLDLSSFDTSQVTSMNEAFYKCNKLEEINLTNVDTSNVTNMYRMFYDCSILTSIDVSNFDTSKVRNMRQMFQNCNNLASLDLSNFNTSNVTNMCIMFYNCDNLTSLDVSNFNTSNVTDMNSMFQNCNNLTSLDVSNFNTSNVTDMNNMFNDCSNLKSLDVSNFDTSKVTKMYRMFEDNRALADLYLNFDVSSVQDFYNIFLHSDNLKNVVGKFEGAKYDLDLSYCPLTADSAMVFINGLATVTEKRRLSLSATTYDSLTPEQIAIATAKGWTVTRS